MKGGLILLLLPIVSCDTDEKLAGRLDHQEAIHFCKRRGYSGITDGVSKSSHERLKSLLQAHESSAGEEIFSMWIGLKRHKFTYLTWLNGTPTDNRNFKVYKDEPMCDYLDLRGDYIYTTDCRKKFRYLCQSKACATFQNNTCNCAKGTCHRIGIGNNDWYSARNNCLTSNEDLATMINKDVIDALSALVLAGHNHEREKMDSDYFWIGARSIDWMLPGATKYPVQYYWFPDEPNPKLDCVVLTLRNGKYGWQSRNCDEKEYFACGSKVYNKEATQSQALTSNQNLLDYWLDFAEKEPVPRETNESLPLALIMLIFFFSLLVPAAASVFLVWCTQRSKDRKKSS